MTNNYDRAFIIYCHCRTLMMRSALIQKRRFVKQSMRSYVVGHHTAHQVIPIPMMEVLIQEQEPVDQVDHSPVVWAVMLVTL